MYSIPTQTNKKPLYNIKKSEPNHISPTESIIKVFFKEEIDFEKCSTTLVPMTPPTVI